MATTGRLAGVAAAALFGSLLMPAASASALSDPPAVISQADGHSDCGHHRGGVAALRREAAELSAQRTTVAADLADAETQLAAAKATAERLQAQVTALQQRDSDLIGQLTLTDLIERSIRFQFGYIDPNSPDASRRIAELEAALAQNEARRAALALELTNGGQELATARAALNAAQQAVVALTATATADTQQLAAIDARLAAIAVELSHDRCDPPNG